MRVLPPFFQNFQHGFRVLAYATKTSGIVSELLELITQYPGQRRPFFEEKTKASQRNLQRWLNQLQRESKIKFEGAPKTGGYWKIDK